MKLKVYFDDAYLEPFENMIYSAALYKRDTTEIQIEVGLWGDEGQNLSSTSRERIMRICRLLGVSLNFCILNEFINRKFSSFGMTIPLDSNLARLDFCLNSEEDFLFLDVDLIMQPGWDELLHLETPCDGMVISAVPDNFVALLISARSNAGHPQHWATLLGEGSDFYFNGGVFIFHHQNWKTQELNAELLRTLYLVDTGEFTTVFGDQDILNFVTRGFKRKFPRMYNSLISTAAGEFAINSFFDPNKDQPRILHFAGEQKPWKCSVEEVHRISKMSDENSKMGYVDHVQNFYFQYFFIQNQRKIWVHNALK